MPVAAPPRGTVLVIDDDAPSRELIGRYMEKEGYRVLKARDGREGIELAHSAHPDVITLDLIMPGHDGWHVLTALKSSPDLKDIPVITRMGSGVFAEREKAAADVLGFGPAAIGPLRTAAHADLGRPVATI